MTDCSYTIFIEYSETMMEWSISVNLSPDFSFFLKTQPERTMLSYCQLWNLPYGPFFITNRYISLIQKS